MHRFVRLIVYTLLVCFLTSASAWAKTVVHHDHDELNLQALAHVQKAIGQASPSDAPTPDQPCDHSCHLTNHLVGLFTPALVIPAMATPSRVSFRLITSHLSRSPDNPYRPPRVLLSV